MICYRAERYQSAWHSTRMISAKILNYTTKDTTPGKIHHHTRKSPQQILYHTRSNIRSGLNQGTVHWYILLVCQWKILIDTSGFPPHAAHWVIWSFKAHTAGWSAGLGGAEIRLSSVCRGWADILLLMKDIAAHVASSHLEDVFQKKNSLRLLGVPRRNTLYNIILLLDMPLHFLKRLL